jgi:hypothetical protein
MAIYVCVCVCVCGYPLGSLRARVGHGPALTVTGRHGGPTLTVTGPVKCWGAARHGSERSGPAMVLAHWHALSRQVWDLSFRFYGQGGCGRPPVQVPSPRRLGPARCWPAGHQLAAMWPASKSPALPGLPRRASGPRGTLLRRNAVWRRHTGRARSRLLLGRLQPSTTGATRQRRLPPSEVASNLNLATLSRLEYE